MKLKRNFTKSALLALAAGCLLLNSQAYAAIYEVEKQRDDALFDINVTDNYFNAAETSKDKYLELQGYLKNKQLNKARSNIDQLLKKFPDDAKLYNYLGLLEMMEENYPAAESSYKKAIKLYDNNLGAYLGLAKISMQKKNLKQASGYYRKVLKIDKKNIFAYVQLAVIADQQKKYRQVESRLKKARDIAASKNFKAELYVVAMLGKWYVKQKRADDFFVLAKDFAKKHPYQRQAHLLLAGAQELNGQAAAAEQTLRKVIADNPKDAQARLLLASLLGKQSGKQSEVIKLLDELHAMYPEEIRYVAIKANYLVSQKLYPEALKTADQAKQAFPQSALGYQLEGDVFRLQKQLDKAIVAYKKAYQVQGSSKLIRLVLMLMAAQQQQEEALNWLKGLLKLNANNLAAHQQLGVLYSQMNDQGRAIKHYQAVLAKVPDDVISLNNLAWIYSQQNNPEAVELAALAYQKAPQSAEIADTYGYILLHNGERPTGLSVLEKALLIEPESLEIQLHVAEANLLAGSKAKGIAMLENIVSSSKNIEFTKKANLLLGQYQ